LNEVKSGAGLVAARSSPDFAALNPGYALAAKVRHAGARLNPVLWLAPFPLRQCPFAQIAARLPQGVEAFAGSPGDSGDCAAFLLVGGGLIQAAPQAMPYETQGVGDVDHLVERILHVEAKLDQFVLGPARAQGRTGTRFSRGHGKTPANPAM
jgi:hypothetical protein